MFSVDAQEWLGTEKLWEYLSSELKGAYEGINAVISHVLKKQWRIWFGSSTYSINIIEVLWRSLKDQALWLYRLGFMYWLYLFLWLSGIRQINMVRIS